MTKFTQTSLLSRISHAAVTAVSIFAIGVQPILAQTIADVGATNGLIVQTAPNGVPLVNIATPNGQGLSHNLYDQFNVGTEGLILNNAGGTFNESQLGGVIPGNGNLGTSGAARVILNEVVGASDTALNGVTEVVGQSADVIIANPNGISCNGCGFIRTPRVVLTTGTPDVAGGALQGFTVQGGEVSFGINGADLSNVSLFDIISRQVTFDGPVTGNEVRIAAGRNAVNFATGEVTALADDGSAAPGFAIDSTAVGGLYAGRISLLSTEAGVAVRAPREMAASAGGMTLTADGRLVIGRAQSSGPAIVRSTAAPVVVETSLFSDDAITLTGTSAEIAAGATLASGADLTVTADTITLGAGALAAAGMNSDGTLGAAGELAFAADTIEATGAQMTAAGDATLTADAITLDQTGGASAVSAAGDLTIETATLSAIGATVATGRDLTIETAALTATGGTVTAGRDLSLTSPTALTITGGDIEAEGDVTVTGDVLTSSAAITSGADVDLSTRTGDLTVTGAVAAEGALGLVSAADLTLTAALRAGTTGTLTASGDLSNSGSVVTGGALTVEAANVFNTAQLGSAGGDLTIISLGDITNDGVFYSGASMRLALDGTLRNNFADIIAENGLTIEGATGARAAAVLNRSANIEAITGSILIAATLVENSQPIPNIVEETEVVVVRGPPEDFPGVSHPSRTYNVIQTTTTVTMVAEAATNAPSQIVAGGDLTINAGTITNTYSALAANGDVTLNAGTILNTGQDLVERVTVSTVSEYRVRYCALRIIFCLDYDYRDETRTTVTQSTATTGAVFATIQAGGTLNATVTGYLGNDAVRDGVAQVGLSSGGRALATPPLIGTVNPNVILGRPALFTPSNSPNSPFLIETRPEFIDVDQFLSSDYFLDQIGGYDPNITQRRFGDAYVEARLIQEQLFALTGRSVTESPEELRALMAGLYDNAVDAAGALNLTPGVSLSAAQVAALTDTIIWLEEQVIDGQTVLVPVVYLGANGIDEVALGAAQIAAAEVVIDAGAVANTGAITGDAGVEIASDTDLLNIGGQITSDGDVTLTAEEGTLASVSGQISGADVTLSGETVEISTAVIRDVTEFGFEDRAQATGEITGVGDVTINSGGDLTVDGAQIDAGGNAVLDAEGTIEITALELETLREQDLDGGFDNSYSLEVEAAGITAGGDVTIAAGEDLTVAGADIAAGGDAALSAEGDVTITSVQEIQQDSFELSIDSGGLFGVETDIREQDMGVTTEQTTIDAGGTLTIASGEGDVVLEAPALSSGGETIVSAENGQVSILTTEDTRFTRDEFREEDLFWWNSEDTGESETSRTFTTIEAGGGLQVISGGEIIVDYIATGDFDQGIAQLAAAPGLEWMGQLQAMDNVAWQEAETAFEEWNYEEQGLTEAGALLVSVVVSFATSGLTAGWAESLASSMGLAAGGAGQAAIQAGLSNLVNTASVSLINNQGDIGAVLEELASEDGLRGLVTAMVSAGLGAHVLGEMGLAGDLPEGTPFLDTALRDLQADLVTASISATVDVAINGGDLGEALFDGWTNAMVMSGLSVVQNEIGDFAAENGIAEGSLEHALAHAVAGGIAAELAGEDFASGALGAAVASLASNLVAGTDLTDARQIELQNLIATAAVLVANGGDASAASLAGAIAASAHENNYLFHEEALQRAAAVVALAECRSAAGSCSAENVASLEAEILRITLLDAARDSRYASACSGGVTSSACVAIGTELDAALGSYNNADLQFANGLWGLPDEYFGTLDPNDPTTAEYQQVVGMRDQLLPQIPWDPEAFGFGLGAGFAIGAGIAATPAVINCLSSAVCGTELVAAFGDDIAMAGGALSASVTVTTTATGSMVRYGDRVIGELIDDGAGVVFRGTTTNFPGSPGTVTVGVTPTSSDPLVAVCYAQNACATFGSDGVVQVIDPNIADELLPGYIPRDLEVGLGGVTPTEAAESALNVIPVEDAISALNQMGITVPRSTGADGLSNTLEQLLNNGTTPLTPQQVQQFLDLTTGSN